MKGKKLSWRFVGFNLVAVVFPALVTVTTVTPTLSHWCLSLSSSSPLTSHQLPLCFPVLISDFSLSLQ